jgi:hypothetical protein
MAEYDQRKPKGLEALSVFDLIFIIAFGIWLGGVFLGVTWFLVMTLFLSNYV